MVQGMAKRQFILPTPDIGLNLHAAASQVCAPFKVATFSLLDCGPGDKQKLIRTQMLGTAFVFDLRKSYGQAAASAIILILA